MGSVPGRPILSVREISLFPAKLLVVYKWIFFSLSSSLLSPSSTSQMNDLTTHF